MRSQAARFGTLLLGAALGFASAARAEAPVTPDGDAGVCMADPGVAIERAGLIHEIAQKLEAEEAPESNGDVVRLNTSGYRYGTDEAPRIARDLQLLDIEVRRARAAARRDGRVP